MMKVCSFKQFPKPYLIYPITLKNNLKKLKVSDVFINLKYVVDSFYVDPRNLVAYKKVCGFGNSNYIPATYFSLLSEVLQHQMLDKENLPFLATELLPIEHHIETYDALFANQRYCMSCHFNELAIDSRKEKQFTYITTVQVNGKKVLESKSIYRLVNQDNSSYTKEVNDTFENDMPKKLFKQWYAPKNIGRKYAQISGVLHPIYIHPWFAKAFGYSEMTVHRMWLKARVLASLNLSKNYKIHAQFKQPIALPSSLQLFTINHALNTTEYCVKSEGNNTALLVGKVVLKS